MIYIIGILAIIGLIAFLFSLLVKAFNIDQQQQDERTLVLEKRINELKKDLTWQIQWEAKLRQDFEHQVNEELLRLKKQIKKVSK